MRKLRTITKLACNISSESGVTSVQITWSNVFENKIKTVLDIPL